MIKPVSLKFNLIDNVGLSSGLDFRNFFTIKIYAYTGINFGAVSQTGGLLLGDEVKINANVQLVKQAVVEVA